jgi:hypothetical protein
LHRLLFFALTILITLELEGQNGGTEPKGRLDQIEAERLEKDRSVSRVVQPNESTVTRIGHFIGRIPIGFQVDGLGPGAGVAVDSVLQRNIYKGQGQARLWGHALFHGFYSTGAGLELRTSPAHDVSFALEGSHADAPQLEYYGQGPDSSIHNRTDFRREDTLFNFRVGSQPSRSVAQTCRLGQLLLNVGPGTNPQLATTQSIFGPDEAPGIDVQSNYFIGGCSAQLDWLDFSRDPHKGTYAAAAIDRYCAENHSRYSFYRLSVVGEQYFPFLNSKRVIAVRAKTELSFHSANQVVPFYLQPTLGSDTDLRGFRRYRFYDENSISLNAEYRWEIGTGFDMAIFADGGNVFHRPGQLSLLQLDSSAGFGFRVKNQSERRVIARLDIGFSREGVQVWLKTVRLF